MVKDVMFIMLFIYIICPLKSYLKLGPNNLFSRLIIPKIVANYKTLTKNKNKKLSRNKVSKSY